MKLNQLAKKLKAKSKTENPEVQFIVCRLDGSIIGMGLKKENMDLEAIAKLFAKTK